MLAGVLVGVGGLPRVGTLFTGECVCARSLLLMPRRSGWSCVLREACARSFLSRMLMLLLLLLQTSRTQARPTDEGTTTPLWAVNVGV